MNNTPTTITIERSVAIRDGLDIAHLTAFYAKSNIIVKVVDDVRFSNHQRVPSRTCEKCNLTHNLDGSAWTRRIRHDGQLGTWRRYCATCTAGLSKKAVRRRGKPIYTNPMIKTSAPSAKECRQCRTDVPLSDFPISPNNRRLWVCQPCLDKLEVERTCRLCDETKPSDRFERHALSLGGRRRECRDCTGARRKAFRDTRSK